MKHVFSLVCLLLITSAIAGMDRKKVGVKNKYTVRNENRLALGITDALATFQRLEQQWGNNDNNTDFAHIIDEHGNTLLHLAAFLSNKDAVSRYQQYVKNNDRNNNGYSPLHVAVIRQNLIVTDLLIKNGADVNQPSPKGTPLTIAQEQDTKEAIDLLRRARAQSTLPEDYRRPVTKIGFARKFFIAYLAIGSCYMLYTMFKHRTKAKTN